MPKDLTLLLAGALMREDGEVGDGEGERDTAGLYEQLVYAIEQIERSGSAYKARGEAHGRSCLGSPD